MLIRWRTLGLTLLPTMLIHAEFSFENIDFDNLSDSEEHVTQKNCEYGNIFCLLQKNTESPLRNENSRTEDEDRDKQFNSQSILSVLSLLRSLFPKGGTNKPNIIFNIRDIQTGFHNSGKNYHIGNIQRELLRSKRGTGDDENENLHENENTNMNNDSSTPGNSATYNADNTSGSYFENESVQDISDSNIDLDTNNSIEHTTMTNSDKSTNRTVSEVVLRSDSTDSKQITINSKSSNTDIMDINHKMTDVYPLTVLNDTSYTNVLEDHTNSLTSGTGHLNFGNAMNINRIYSKSNSTTNTINDLYNEIGYESTTVNTDQSLDTLQLTDNKDFNISNILSDRINSSVNKFSDEGVSENNYKATTHDGNDSLARASNAETETKADKTPEPSQYFVPKPNTQTNDLSDDQLKELQTVLDKELGIDTVNYAATRNFSFTIAGSNSRSSQPIVVIVYKCNCANNAVETNKNNFAQSDDVNNNNIINKNNNHSYEYFYKYWRMVPHNSNLANHTNKTLNTHLNPGITMDKLLQCQTLLAAMTNNISAHTENVEEYPNRNRDSVSPQVLRIGNDRAEGHSRTKPNIKTLNRDEGNLNGGVSTHGYIDLLADGLKTISRAPILNYIPVPKPVGTYHDWRSGHSNAQYHNNHILKNLGIDLLKKREVDNATIDRYMDNEPVSKENSMSTDNKYFKYDVNDDDDIFKDVNRDGSKADSETRITTSAFKYDDDSISTTALMDSAETPKNKKETIEATTKRNHNKKYDDSSSDSDDNSSYDDDDSHRDGLKIKIKVLWDNHKLTN